MENSSSIDIIARGMAANAESGVSGLKASVSEILRSMADPYDPTHTYTTGQLVMNDGRLYRALVDITAPEAWTPAHWQAVDLEDEITQLRAELAQKYSASNPPPYPVTSVNGRTGGVVLNYITYDEEEE